MFYSSEDEKSYCIYCKKEILKKNKVELIKGYHRKCRNEINKFNASYKELENKFSLLQQTYPDSFKDWAFSDIIYSSNKSLNVTISDSKFYHIIDEIDCLLSAKYLNLYRNNLTDLPQTLCSMSKLISLDISYNNFNVVPEVIQKMESLKSLTMNYNQLISLPRNLINLNNLFTLNVKGNKITELPENLEFFKLKILNLGFNKLSIKSPLIYGNQKTLDILILQGNNLKKIPDSLYDIKIFGLDFSINPLKKIPNELFDTSPTFIDLDFHNCNLTALPETIRNCQLSRLDISHNNIKSLPELAPIRNLFLNNNPISELPMSVITDGMFLHISNTKIEEIPKIVKEISIDTVYLNNKNLADSFNPHTRIIYSSK